MTELRKKPGTACAEVFVDDVLVGEVEFKDYPPANTAGPAWRWRNLAGGWGDVDTQEEAVEALTGRQPPP